MRVRAGRGHAIGPRLAHALRVCGGESEDVSASSPCWPPREPGHLDQRNKIRILSVSWSTSAFQQVPGCLPRNREVIAHALAGHWHDGNSLLVTGACPSSAEEIAERIWRPCGGLVERHPDERLVHDFTSANETRRVPCYAAWRTRKAGAGPERQLRRGHPAQGAAGAAVRVQPLRRRPDTLHVPPRHHRRVPLCRGGGPPGRRPDRGDLHDGRVGVLVG